MRILLVQLSWLGDSVLATALVAPLAKAHPEATLDVLTTPAARDIFISLPQVSRVVLFDKRGEHRGLRGLWKLALQLRRQRYSKVVSLHRSARTALVLALAGIRERIGFSSSSLAWLYTKRRVRPSAAHEVWRNVSVLGDSVTVDTLELPQLQLVAPAAASVRKDLVDLMGQPAIVLFPCSAWPTKRWQAAGFRQVAQHYLKQGLEVIILGALGERDYNATTMSGLSVHDLTGSTSIGETLYIVERAKLVVCNDSFGLHVASAFKRPTVAIFCATSPSFGFGPWDNPWAEVVEVTDLACKPCRRHGSKHCPTGTSLCMSGISADQVISVADRLMELHSSQVIICDSR